MSETCNECGAQLTLETQKVGEKLSSDDHEVKPFYSVRCNSCDHKNPDKVQKLISEADDQ